MQLILDTETTVDLKTKMSLNEENLGKSVSDILPGVQNGDISNGEATNGDDNANKDMDKLEQLKDSIAVNTERILEHNTDSVVENNIESLPEHTTDSLLEDNSDISLDSKSTDIINGNNSDSGESLANVVEPTEHSNNLNESEETKSDTVDKDHLEQVRNSMDSESNQEGLPENIKNECVNESESTITEHNGDNISSIPGSEYNPVLDNDNSANTTNADSSGCVTIKKEYDETAVNTSITTEVNFDLDIKTEIAELNCEELDIKQEIPDESQANLETDDDTIKSRTVKSETEENVSVPEEIEPMETDNAENDTSDENVDLIRLDFNQYICDKQNDPVVNETEKEEHNAIDPVQKEGTKSDDTTDMDVDISIDNVSEKETSEIGSTTTTANVIECPEQKDSEPIEPGTTKITDSESLNVDSSDDTIVNLDDDKEKSAKPADVKKSESAQVIVDNDKPIINCDDDAEIADNTEEPLNKDPILINEVIDLDENMPKVTLGSDLSAEENKKQSANTKEKSTVDNCGTVIADKTVETLNKDSNPINEVIDLDENVPKVTLGSEFSAEESKKQSANTKEKSTVDNYDTEIADKTVEPLNKDSNPINEVIDLDENLPKVTLGSELSDEESKKQPDNTKEKSTVDNSKPIEPILKLSNTLDILSDDEEEQVRKSSNTDSKCINIEDDDDVMLIDDEPSGTENKSEPIKEQEIEKHIESKPKIPAETVNEVEDSESTNKIENLPEQDNKVTEKEEPEPAPISDISEKIEESPIQPENKKPLMPENFLKTCKKNLVDMSREELEEFCILKIVESVLDRSNLSEIKNKLKTLTQNIEDYKKKAMMLSKQNRDLQVVLKSVQEDVKKYNATPIVPLKITRSVGMQVLMSDRQDKRRRTGIGMPNPTSNKVMRSPTMQIPRAQKPPPQQIPVPRLVPANNPAMKSPVQQVSAGKVTSPLPNGVKTVSPAPKAEKRTHSRIQSVTVDLTDDEPPAKVVTRTPGPVPPVRLVPSQNLLAAPRTPGVNSPRKVYIPISGPQGQNVRPGQTIMLKTVPTANTRQRVPPPHMVRMPQSIRMTRPQGLRHPAPLPECMKQYQPPNWKALPPAPDLKLAKVENGIVISWKIEGYQEDSYEEIASYQLYAYQETTSPPNTALWKKIGDVKALPLPMACTLTQFMAGYKYYFAVRAVDIRSRLGPFSLPGSILLLNKM